MRWHQSMQYLLTRPWNNIRVIVCFLDICWCDDWVCETMGLFVTLAISRHWLINLLSTR